MDESDSKPGHVAMPFLKNVTEGDKRIVVCCRKILGAALRKPKIGSWICNVSQGGKSSLAEPDSDEVAIIRHLTPVLEKLGIVFYGIDTLVNDDSKRVLSEINTLSTGGLMKIEEYSGKPVSAMAADLLLDYINDPEDYLSGKRIK
jgi:glutathione synthase